MAWRSSIILLFSWDQKGVLYDWVGCFDQQVVKWVSVVHWGWSGLVLFS